MEQVSRIGMDTSKHVFQLHGMNAAEEVVLRKKLRRKEMVAFFEKLAPTAIAIEACASVVHGSGGGAEAAGDVENRPRKLWMSTVPFKLNQDRRRHIPRQRRRVTNWRKRRDGTTAEPA